MRTVLAVAVAATMVAAQSRPDFAGKWVLDERRTALAEAEQERRVASGGDKVWRSFPAAERLELALDGATLTVAMSGGRGESSNTFTLDGVTRPFMTGWTRTARWRGRTIEIEVRRSTAPPQRTEYLREGEWLVVRQAPSSDVRTKPESRSDYYGRAK